MNLYDQLILYFSIFSTILATLLYVARSINWSGQIYPRHQYQHANLLFPTGGSIRKPTAQTPTYIRLKVGLRILDLEFTAQWESSRDSSLRPIFPVAISETTFIRWKDLGRNGTLSFMSYILLVNFTRSEDNRMIYRCSNSNSSANSHRSKA